MDDWHQGGHERSVSDEWMRWCATQGVSTTDATIGDISDFVLDLMLDGTPTATIVDALERAGEATGSWRTSRYATLRLGLG